MAALLELLDDDEAKFWRTLPGEGDGAYVAREAVCARLRQRCWRRKGWRSACSSRIS